MFDGIIAAYHTVKPGPDDLKSARKLVKNLPLNKDNWVFANKCPINFKRWLKIDAKKRGYYVNFSDEISNYIVLTIYSEEKRLKAQNDRWEAEEDRRNTPG